MNKKIKKTAFIQNNTFATLPLKRLELILLFNKEVLNWQKVIVKTFFVTKDVFFK